MKRHLIAALLGGFLLAGCAGQPEQQAACLAPEQIVQHLQQKYGETPIWVGEGDGFITVLFLARTGTWTVATITEEIACLDRAGLGFNIRGMPS